MQLTAELVNRDLTRTEQNILNAIANNKGGVAKKDLVRFTTESGLPKHLWAIRTSLVNGYQIKGSNGRYKLVDVPNSDPLTTESPHAAIHTKMAEKRSVVESEIQVKIDAKRQLEIEISALQMELAKIDNFIDVFDQYFTV